MDLTRVPRDINMYDTEWPIWTHQEQLPPAKFVFDDDGRRGMAVDSVVSGGCIISGGKIAGSLLFSNVHVHSYSSIEDSVILPDVEVHQSVRLNRVVVEKRCTLPKGLAVGFDPAEDRKRFHVSERGITLITPETLGQEVLHQGCRIGRCERPSKAGPAPPSSTSPAQFPPPPTSQDTPA